ncbi:ABC transporter permease [Botrimarina hoheduenensis]|uniref:Oligopeptide transport system permease protein OppC n=1 Tax=Botrimarina hoheduenensis TaxID=2528000 RepID=A0A5C5W8T4_9BACT|nr:ABC transporter permease [Botrimarina hoheduenensis]TWT47308.1 Oligopeptide transport system permease protein OppC [Botrimarina hoheduenensis]
MTTPPLNAKRAGVSLTQDAIRRLSKNLTAMISFAVLVVVVGLAVLTPLLPLQPPDRDLTAQMFAEPTAERLFEKTFNFDPQVNAVARERLPAALEKRGVRQAELKSLLADAKRTPEAESQSRRNLRQAEAAIVALEQRAYASVGYPHLGPLSRWMVRTRHALFGEWQLASVCGRDKLGRDLLSRIFWGARVSLIVGVVATLVSLAIGVTWGSVAGYVGGSVDNLMMRIVDVLYSVPFVFLVIFLISILSEDRVKDALAGYGIDRITIFYFVVGAIYWLTMARVVRGQVVSLRNEPFIEAARSIGVSQTAIIFRHIVPNLLSIVVVYLTLTIPRVILFEAFLSFLGLGVEPPDVSWGLLANEGIQVITPIKIYWWLILFPSLAIGVTLFALNFLGDAIRDAFDPRLKGR